MFKLNTLCDDIDSSSVKSIAVDDAHCITLWSTVNATFDFRDFSLGGAPEPLMLSANLPITIGPPPVGAYESMKLYYQSSGDDGNMNVVWW